MLLIKPLLDYEIVAFTSETEIVVETTNLEKTFQDVYAMAFAKLIYC